MQAFEVRDHQLELRLEGYARARLSPDPQAIARSRARIMREARLQFDGSRTATHPAPPIVARARRSAVRRVAMPLLAASVWVVIAVGSISAAQPGGPLYTSRMWVENATLPASGPARATAELQRLDARLAEAASAASRGDMGAVQAALAAYQQIADETVAATAGDEGLEAIVAGALDKHRAVLTAVAASLSANGNDKAAAAVGASIQRAIDHNQATIDRIAEHRAGGGNGSTGGSTGSPGGTGAGTGSGTGSGSVASPPVGTDGGTGAGTGGSGTGSGGDKPAKTPKPTPDPPTQPTPKPTPDRGQPDHTPRGQNP